MKEFEDGFWEEAVVVGREVEGGAGGGGRILGFEVGRA